MRVTAYKYKKELFQIFPQIQQCIMYKSCYERSESFWTIKEFKLQHIFTYQLMSCTFTKLNLHLCQHFRTSTFCDTKTHFYFWPKSPANIRGAIYGNMQEPFFCSFVFKSKIVLHLSSYINYKYYKYLQWQSNGYSFFTSIKWLKIFDVGTRRWGCKNIQH